MEETIDLFKEIDRYDEIYQNERTEKQFVYNNLQKNVNELERKTQSNKLLHRISLQIQEDLRTVIPAREELYGTVTHTSLYRALQEIQRKFGNLLENNKTAFIDFGSGMGSLLFYVWYKYRTLSALVGVEKDVELHQVALFRRNALSKDWPSLESSVKLIAADIFDLNHLFFDKFEAETIVLLSFDTLWPKSLTDHVHRMIEQSQKHIIWITNQNRLGASKMDTQLAIGPPGVTENDDNVRVILGDRDKDNDEKDSWIIDDDEEFDANVIELTGFSVYVYEKKQTQPNFKKFKQGNACIECKNTSVMFRIKNTPFIVCSGQCAKQFLRKHGVEFKEIRNRSYRN